MSAEDDLKREEEERARLEAGARQKREAEELGREEGTRGEAEARGMSVDERLEALVRLDLSLVYGLWKVANAQTRLATVLMTMVEAPALSEMRAQLLDKLQAHLEKVNELGDVLDEAMKELRKLSP